MSTPSRSWLPVVLWVLVIYTTIPFVRMIRDSFAEHWDLRLITWLVALCIVGSAVASVALLRRHAGTHHRLSLAWIIGITGALVLWTFSLRRSPEEAVHLVEYGVLAVLLHRALRPTMRDATVFAAGALIGALVGFGDEIIQWLSPTRTWDWRDVAINAGAGALTQLGLRQVVAPVPNRVSARSLRIVLRLAAALVLLTTLCLANTPRRVARYAPLLPNADHLTSSLNPMAEYGHLHVAPGLGSFKSRLDLSELELEDRFRATEVAAVLDATRHRYSEFLDTWSVADDPFTYEARVHLFARDRNLGKARDDRLSEAARREHLSIAWFENRLLEEFFGNSLSRSAYPLSARRRQQIESAHDPDLDFRSAAGSNLITFAPEGRIRAALLVIVALLVVADLTLARYHRRRS
jgi:hypothetical protein